ncbi:MAG: hypothetical protein AAF958_05470 [Planctomycetota bacterium]
MSNVTETINASIIRDTSSNLPVATQILGDGESQVLDLVVALAAFHRDCRGQDGGGHGGIAGDCLRVDDKDRLCLVLGPPRGERSPCHNTASDDPKGRFYFNLGTLPRPVDDLTALGVVLGELQLPPASRPDFLPQVSTYRKRLAGALRHRSRHHADARLRQLTRELLLAPEKGFSDAVSFLRSRPHFLALDHDGHFRRPSLAQRFRRWPWFRAILLVLAILSLGWWLGGGDNPLGVVNRQPLQDSDAPMLARGELEFLRAENSALRARLESRTNVAATAPVGIPTAAVTRGELYERYGELPAFRNAKVRRLLKQLTLGEEEFEYLQTRLTGAARASNVWWSWVRTAADDRQIQAELAGADADVAAMLRGWLADANRPREYTLRVRKLVKPAAEASGSYDLSVNDQQTLLKTSEWEQAEPIVIRWRYGDPIQVQLERRWTYLLYDADIIKVSIGGELAMPRLQTVKLENSDAGYALALSVEPGIGPPRPVGETGTGR